MNSIDEKNIDNLREALLKAAGNNNTSFSDDIEDNISLQSIKKLAEIEVTKMESVTTYYLSIVGITAAFVGIGLSEIFWV